MTDTNYLYEYFLANSPDEKEDNSASRQEDNSQEDEEQ
jgi:hypothetical protein